jgi:hypothetical protein
VEDVLLLVKGEYLVELTLNVAEQNRQDCSTTANARATGCDEGQCQVYSCFDGYVVTPDRKACVKKGSVVPATPVTAFTQLVMEEVPLF